MRHWGDREAPDDWEITTKTAEEMKEVYRHAQYGFVLRDDIVVNNVACPTKIIDYIKYDIIPIVKSPHIGDFEGMEWNIYHWKIFCRTGSLLANGGCKCAGKTGRYRQNS